MQLLAPNRHSEPKRRIPHIATYNIGAIWNKNKQKKQYYGEFDNICFC